MLQVRNLVKIYKPKKGVPVRALDNVNLTFPKTGMVFLLGKSGSGKSTLLNLLGGLDRYDSGDILILGESTSKFKQSHFDSYRNTYVGFIFQEYNILDEFSVGTNIALALQLQGQKADSQRVNEILKDVDLDGYGNRKPNELSGGQKQRVAIARALVKNPKIIMADEPTGALDSTTGRQVLTTLKKLSRDKLVIVVSHDREFAEQYADRIIELADGRVIRDVEKTYDAVDADNAMPVFEEESVGLPESYVLTDEDKAAICKYIQDRMDAGKAPKFSILGKTVASFQPTDTARIQTSHEGYKLIKSRLPMSYAFKMGASGLKHKKFRLVMTILLSCIALILFGLADTVASYDYVNTAYNSLVDAENRVSYAAFEKQITYHEDDYSWSTNTTLTGKDLERLEEETGLELVPVYGDYYDISFTQNVRDNLWESGYDYKFASLGGFVELDEDLLDTMGAELIEGEMPREGTNDIAISTVYVQMFEDCGYRNWNNGEETDIDGADDLIGKSLQINEREYVICGIVDTGVDVSEYMEAMKEYAEMEHMEMADQITYTIVSTEMRYSLNYSLTGLGMIAPGGSHELALNSALQRYMLMESELHSIENMGSYFLTVANEECLKNVVWLDGKSRTSLAKDEIVMTADAYYGFINGEMPDNMDFQALYSEGKDLSALAGMEFKLTVWNDEYYYYERESDSEGEIHKLKLVGIVPYAESNMDENYDEETGEYMEEPGYAMEMTCYISEELVAGAEPNICQTLAPMPEDNGEIMKLVEFSAMEFEGNEEDTTISYGLMNPISFELKNLDGIFETLGKVFLWVGLGFVVFASLLFSNFIAVSISYKKQEIGILRAIGSRSNDVFRIFFAESFCIAMINFALSIGGTVLACWLLNTTLKVNIGLKLTILNVGIRQVGLLFGVCLLVAAVASFLPVRKIAAKRPIDAIRDR